MVRLFPQKSSQIPRLNRLLPDWVPFHPHKWWIHTRTVYIPMSYLYGVRFKMPENDLILALREVCIRFLRLQTANVLTGAISGKLLLY
jgi:squalene cyclase